MICGRFGKGLPTTFRALCTNISLKVRFKSLEKRDLAKRSRDSTRLNLPQNIVQLSLPAKMRLKNFFMDGVAALRPCNPRFSIPGFRDQRTVIGKT